MLVIDIARRFSDTLVNDALHNAIAFEELSGSFALNLEGLDILWTQERIA